MKDAGGKTAVLRTWNVRHKRRVCARPRRLSDMYIATVQLASIAAYSHLIAA
jgi:hypothetical protein